MVIPALKGQGKGNQMSEYPDDMDPDRGLMAEQLTPNERQIAQPLIDQFGEDAVKKLFSKTWQLREEALS